MNLFDIIKEILLALCIAILLPVTLYWGINIVHKNPQYADFEVAGESTGVKFSDAKIKEASQKLQMDNWLKARKEFDNVIFYSSLLLGIILIVAGSLLSINSLSIGFIAGGFLNICVALFHNPGVAVLNFIIFISLLTILIALTALRRKR